MDDLISRQAAKSKKVYSHERHEYVVPVAYIDWLPSAQPERKRGKWIHGKELGREMIGDCIIAIFYDGWKCSECGCTVEEERQPTWKFCPNCGSEMKEEEDDKR